MHLLSRIGCTCITLIHTIENTYEDAFIMFYHIIHVIIHAFAISYAIFMHIGSTEEITLLEFNKEEEGDQQETPLATTPEEEEQTLEELPECLDHCPTSFLKGKPGAL